jgi:hypothetical protein
VTDEELEKWWPELGTVVAALRSANRPEVADRLVDAVRAGATSSEILGAVGAVLKEHRALRAKLAAPAPQAWDAIVKDARRAFPGFQPPSTS